MKRNIYRLAQSVGRLIRIVTGFAHRADSTRHWRIQKEETVLTKDWIKFKSFYRITIICKCASHESMLIFLYAENELQQLCRVSLIRVCFIKNYVVNYLNIYMHLLSRNVVYMSSKVPVFWQVLSGGLNLWCYIFLWRNVSCNHMRGIFTVFHLFEMTSFLSGVARDAVYGFNFLSLASYALVLR